MMEGAHKIWLKLLGDRPAKGNAGKQEIYDVRYAFLDCLKEVNPEIFAGDYGAALSRHDLEILLEKFQKKPGNLNAGLRTFVSRALRKGKEKLGWQVSIPPILVDLPRERARFTPESFLKLQKIRRVEQAMLSVRDKNPPEELKLRVGQLLLSAVLFGGLVHREWLHPWISALFERVRIGGGMLWLDMELVWQYEREAFNGSNGKKVRSQEQRIVRQRRWIADPATRFLILRSLPFLRVNKDASKSLPNAWDILQAYFRNLSASDFPETLQEFFVAVRTRLCLHVPGFLASYAEGGLMSVSVPPATWVRLCESKAVPVSRGDEFDDASITEEVKKVRWGSGDETFADQQKILLLLRRVVSRKGKGAAQCEREISEIIDRQRERLFPILGYLASWSRYLLSRKKGNSPSTVDRYLSSVADKLLVVCGSEDILEWSTGEFTESYSRVIELVKQKSEKGYARDTLGRLHRYLEQKHRVPPVGDGFFRRRSAPAEVRVDANLVSQREFDLVKEVLGFEDAISILQRGPEAPAEGGIPLSEPGQPILSRRAVVCILTAILGFRCGLRRNEVRYLRLNDFHEEGNAELIVRPTQARKLKSLSATRRIPLHVLLPPDELRLLLSWKAYRLREEKNVGQRTLLFSVSGLPTTPMTEAKVFPVIREALVRVTGDASLRYHHLRHSFATWLLVRVTGKSTGLRREAPFLVHQEFDDDRISMIREQLLGNEYLGRKGAYLVAALCGHAEVGTTFESYVHLSEWLLCRELSRDEVLPTVSPGAAVRLAGMSRALAYRYTRKDAAGTVWFDWESAFSGGSGKLVGYRDPLVSQATDLPLEQIVIEDEVDQKIPLWMTVSKVLHMAQAEGRSIEEICAKLELPKEAVERWLENARHISTMQTRKTKRTKTPSFRHVQIHFPSQGVQGKRIKRKTKNDIFPSPLVYDHDRSVATEILSTFEKLSGTERRIIFDMVDYFLEKFSVQSGMVCFYEIPRARRYVDALVKLGISELMIRLIDCRRNSKDPSSKDPSLGARREDWEKGLGLEYCNWQTNHKNWGRKQAPGTVGIQVLAEVNEQVKVSYAFRYSLYMIAIAYWN